MSVKASMGVSNRAFEGEDGPHSLSKDSGIADLTDVIPQLPPKKSPRQTPKVFVKNPSAHKYENQMPLPQGAGSANSSSKRRPDNLAIPSHISSTQRNGDRPVSSVHDYEELPLEKRTKGRPRLEKYTPSDERYTPSPPPMPPLSSIPSQNFDIYSNAGSDVTMISDGPRKRQNPLYDSTKVISQPDPKISKKRSDCFNRNKLFWIFLIIIAILTVVLLVLLILVIIGAVGVKEPSSAGKVEPHVDPGARNQTLQLEAALESALKRVKDLESKVVELDTIVSFLGNSSQNSSLLSRFDEVVKNTSLNTALVVKFRDEALNNNQAVIDKINQLESSKIDPLQKTVDGIVTRVTAINETIQTQLLPEMQTIQSMRDDIIRLNETALTDCKLNTTIFESFASVHNELDTPYVYETADYVIVGIECSSFGFKATTRSGTQEMIDNSPRMKFKCVCTTKWDNAKVQRCAVHALMCSTKKQ